MLRNTAQVTENMLITSEAKYAMGASPSIGMDAQTKGFFK